MSLLFVSFSYPNDSSVDNVLSPPMQRVKEALARARVCVCECVCIYIYAKNHRVSSAFTHV